jgi:diphthine-ammonia ligase
MKLAVLVSGGKDSLYAAYLASQENQIEYLIAMVPENTASYMFHHPNVSYVKQQASLMGIALIEKRTKGEKEKELDDLEEVLGSIRDEIDGVVTGAVASTYQKLRIDAICKRLGLLSIAPLWHTEPQDYMKKMIREGFETVIVGVAAPPLNEEWLGRRVDDQCIDELVVLNKKHGIHVAGEGGEFETFVTDSPMFFRKIEIISADKNWNEKERNGTYDIKEVKIVQKG